MEAPILTVSLVVTELLVSSWVTAVDPAYNLCDVKPGFSLNGDFFPQVGDSSTVYINLTGTNENSVYHCYMRFTTCPECHFKVEEKSSFSFPACMWRDTFLNYNGKCAHGCTYLHMFDPDYRNETAQSYSHTPWPSIYMTESRTIYIVVCSNRSMVKNVSLSVKLTVIAKQQDITGSAFDRPLRYITSPTFPNFYAENDEVYTYHFKAINQDEYIWLTFDDWNLSPRSLLWFQESEIQGPVSGANSRPVVVSIKDVLIVKFSAGTPTSNSIRVHMGFKATYEFRNKRRNVQRPITECGDYKMNTVGGTVTFNPLKSTKDYYDCIWVLKRHADFSMIYAKLIEYDSSPMYYPDQPDRLEIRGGLTSLGRYKAEVTFDNVDDYKMYSFENNTGFYIRLQGQYQHARDFVMAYASFRYGDCRRSEFRCTNGRCISDILKCNDRDHCGDNSDESSALCGGGSDHDYGRYSYTISIGVIIPMVISIFLIVVICLLIIFIRRCRSLSQQHNHGSHQPIGSVSGNMARRNRRGRNRSRIRMNLTIQQDSPPSYDEVIRNTPIGYLNMAFMWSQPDVNTGMVSPPTYEEAVSPTTELPRLMSSQNVLNQSAESTSSSDSLESHPCVLPRPSDSSSDGSQLEDHLRQTSFSSDSTLPERDCYQNCDTTGPCPPVPRERRNDQRMDKPVEDKFIECPVSSSHLDNKDTHERQVPDYTEASRNCPREEGASASPVHAPPSEARDRSSRPRDRSSRPSDRSSRPSDRSSRPREGGQSSPRKKQRNSSRPRSEEEPEHEHDQPLPRQRGRRGNISQQSPSRRRDSSGGRGEVVLRVPSPASTPVPVPRGRVVQNMAADGEPRLTESRDDSGRLRGTYLSLSLDTGDGEEPDIFV